MHLHILHNKCKRCFYDWIKENKKTTKEMEEVKMAKWVCGICGYEYDGTVPFEELPDDFVCPICKQPKTVFKKVD